MRTISLAVALAACVAATPVGLSAQFTLKGGVNLVDFFGDDVQSSDRRARLAGGASFDLLSVGPFTLAPELYYAQQGADNFEQKLQQGQPVRVSLEYVEIPVLLRLALPFGGQRLSPYVAGGPVFGWQLDCSFEAAQQGTTENCAQLLGGQDQLEETLRDYEQGLAFGAGFAVNLLRGFGAVTLDARYTLGMTRLSDDEDGPDIQNRAFALLLGYRLGG